MTVRQQIFEDYRALIERDAGLGGAHCTSQEIFEAERTQIFLRTWVCIALADEVGSDGDLLPLEFLGLPLLLVRQRGLLRVFHNVCSHRGALLLESPAQGRIRITCPYHAWTYDLSGKLVQTPHVGGEDRHTCAGIDASRLGLRSVRAAEWCGHVFVDLSGEAPEFAEWIRPVERRFVDLHEADVRRDAAMGRDFDLAANWKLIAENFCESYHLPYVHRELNRVNPMGRHYQILGGLSYAGQGSTGYAGDQATGGRLPLLTQRMDRSHYDSLYVFPNLMLVPFPDMMFSLVLLPFGPARTIERLNLFVAGDDAMQERYAPIRQSALDFVLNISREDFGVLESLQKGRRSPAFAGGQFAPLQETTSLHIQKMVAAHMLAAERGVSPDVVVQLPYQDIAHPAPAP